jgi:UPF0716 family protein affecting phage T7 exclusion
VSGGGVPFILGQLPSGLQDVLLLLIIFAFFSCGTGIVRARGWVPEGKFRLGSPRAYFNLDWITLVVVFIVAIVGVIFFLIAHGGKELSEHLRDDAETPAALREH